MTVEEALSFFENVPRVRSKIQTLYDVGLSYVKLGQPSTTLSGGEAQRVKLATELSKRSTGKTIYILDEPLGGVDPASRDYILQTILKNFDKNATLFISTHMIADIEEILDDVIFIDNGEIILKENAEKLRKKEKCSIDEIFRRKFYVSKITKK
jgi:excinuclease ABC subunit A